MSSSDQSVRHDAGSPRRVEDESVPDHSLLRRFRRGEQDAATELYLRYASRLQALASSQTPSSLATRFDADDVVQSVFRTLFRRVSEGMYDVPPGDELWQLLLVIALNKIRKLAIRHRAQKRDVSKTRGSVTLEKFADRHQSPDETSLCVLELVIDELMYDLPESHRKIVQLRIEGYQASDIAAQTKRSKRTVERALHDFRQELGSRIND